MPYGRFVNSQFDGDPAGTPLEAEWANEFYGAFQAILSAGGLTPNNSPETINNSQIKDAIAAIASVRANHAFTGLPSGGNLVTHIPLQAPGVQSIWQTTSNGMTQLTPSSFEIDLHVAPPGKGWRPLTFTTYFHAHDPSAPTPLLIELKRGIAYATSDTPTVVASITANTAANSRSSAISGPAAAIQDSERFYVAIKGQDGGTFSQPRIRALRITWTPVA
jgi:hypothetical protein